MKLISIKNLNEEAVSHNDEIKKKVLIRNGEVPKMTQYAQVIFKPGQIAPAHTHQDMYEMFLAISGSGVMVVNGKENKIEAGEMLVVEPKELHEVRNLGNEDLILNIIGIKE